MPLFGHGVQGLRDKANAPEAGRQETGSQGGLASTRRTRRLMPLRLEVWIYVLKSTSNSIHPLSWSSNSTMWHIQGWVHVY